MKTIVLSVLFAAHLAAQTAVSSTATGSITAASASCTSTACVYLNAPQDTGAFSVQLSGSFVATLQFESSVDGTTWVSTPGTASAAAAGAWNFSLGAQRYFRVRASAFTSGPVTVAISAAKGTALPGVTSDGANGMVVAGNVVVGTAVSGQTVPALGKESAPATYTVLGLTDNGLSRVVQSRPIAETKRIVIMGSSVASGAVASAGNSWAEKFAVAMTARGWTVINISISGQGTAQAIARFWTDVAPLKPDVVIHSTGWFNDGFAVASYEANILRLIQMTEQIGAIAVVHGQYANSNWTAQNYLDARSVEAWKESLNIPTWDWLGVTADPTNGHWLTGMDSGDGLHPNDTGHAAMFAAIPLSMFDRLILRRPLSAPTQASAWQWAADASSPGLRLTLDSPAPSWTVTTWVRENRNASGARVYLALYASVGANMIGRVRNPSNAIDYVDNAAAITSTTDSLDSQWHHIAVTYNATSNLVALYTDGVLVTSRAANQITAGALAEVQWWGRSDSGGFTPQNSQIFAPMVYRTTLNASQIAALANDTNYPRASLEWFSGLSGPVRQNLTSDANTAAVATATFPALWSAVTDTPLLYKSKQLQLAPTAQPTCVAAIQGRFWNSGHTTGVKDTVQVCAADAANAYAWRTIY